MHSTGLAGEPVCVTQAPLRTRAVCAGGLGQLAATSRLWPDQWLCRQQSVLSQTAVLLSKCVVVVLLYCAVDGEVATIVMSAMHLVM
jgi:hypothetical protein